MQPGELIWVKFGDFPTWPCRLAIATEVGKSVLDLELPNTTLVYFFGSHNYAWVEPEFVYDFQSNYNKYSVRSKMAQFRKGLHEANEWKNNKDKVLPVTKASRKRVVISDESGEEEEDSIQDSDQDRETSKSSKSKNTTKSNGNAKRLKEPIEVDSADESDYSGPENDFKPSKSKSSAVLNTKSSRSKTETKKPKISTRSRTLKTVQSTANIGSDRAKSLEITKADRNGITINNKTLTLNTKSIDKDEKSVKKEVTSNGHSNGHANKREKEKKREEEEEEEKEDEDRMLEDDKDEDEILTELMSAQRPREEEENKHEEESDGEQQDNWYAPTQPYRSDDSDDERRRPKAKIVQARRSPVPKQTQYDNEDEVKLGSSVEIIPVGKNATHKMSVNGQHSVSLQEKKPDTRPLPKMTNTNRQLLSTSSNRRRSDETGETGSHHNNSESLFDDSDKTTVISNHSPSASNGKTSRAPGTPIHLVSPPLEPRGSSPFLSKNKHKRRISEVSPTQRVTPSYDLDESASLFDDLTSPSGHVIKRRRVTDTPLNNAVPALDMSVVKEMIENEVALKLATVNADWETKFTVLKGEFEKQHNTVMDKVKELLKNQKNDVQNILKQQKTSLEQILTQEKLDNKTQMKDLAEQIETISGSITELDKRLEAHMKQLSDQQSAIIDKSIVGAESLLSSLRSLTSKSHK
jgi:hypothetical protein